MFTYKTTFDNLFDTVNSAHKLEQFQDKDFFVYSLEVPYFKKEDLSVTFKNGKIFVDGKKELYGRHFDISTSFKIHSDYSEEDVIVEYVGGVLFFKFPKNVKSKGTTKLKIV